MNQIVVKSKHGTAAHVRCERDIIIAANMIIYDDQRGLHLLDVGVLEHGHVGDVQLDHVQLGRVSHFLPSELVLNRNNFLLTTS